jgi:thiosulfate reductase cytochrome b subunit
MAAGLHRLGAIMTVGYFSLHLATLAGVVWKNIPTFRDEQGKFRVRRVLGLLFGPDSPLPNKQDLTDFIAHNRWFFGRGKQPAFDRWTYWEKFDYLAVFWGVPVIGLSGLIMWIPQVFTRVLPGWVINVAHIVHSDEALLATGFIFTFHFFNVHFRAEKFPMDPVIFSGRITEEEMLHERRRQYDRLKAAGKLDDVKVGDEWARWKKIFTPIGMTAFGIGVALIIAIYWVMARRLLHG